MKYNVTITEILEKTIEIEAENETNAIDIARDKYNKEEVILTADDLADTWFSLYEQQGERVISLFIIYKVTIISIK